MTDLRVLREIKVEVASARGASMADIARRTGNYGVLPTDNDFTALDKLGQTLLEENPAFQSVVPGPAGPTYLTLALFRAAPTSNRKQALLDPAYPAGDYYFETANAPYAENLPTIIKANSTALSVGAWVRQRAAGIDYQISGGRSRPLDEKQAEAEKSITDYGTGSDWGALVDLAVARLGTVNKVRLITPPGAWTAGARDYSAYRNLTFVIRPGAVINNSANAIVLPERVVIGMDAGFTGTGIVSQRNKDEAPLQEPPGGYERTGNMASGLKALAKNIGGHNNNAQGADALAAAQYVRSAIAIGKSSQRDVVGDATGSRATLAGSGEILSYYAPGDAGIAIGDYTLVKNKTGVEMLAIGAYSLRDNVSGTMCVAIGGNSQILSTAGNFNISVGGYCLTVNQGSNNIAIGWAALEGQLSGSNVAIGHASLNGNKTGTRNLGVGALTLQMNSTGDDNIAIGIEVLKNARGGNVFRNVAIGNFALGQISTGGTEGNVALGHEALLTFMTGINNTAVGTGAMGSASSVSNSSAIGAGAQVTGSNQIQLGGEGVTPYAFGALQLRSDARDKADIRDTVLGLDFINALRPVDYRFDLREDYLPPSPPPSPPSLFMDRPSVPLTEEQRAANNDAVKAYEESLAQWRSARDIATVQRDGTKKRTRFHHGLIAQELQALIADTGVDFGGFQHHSHSDENGLDVMSIGYDELIAPLIKAVQQLTARVAELEAAQ